MTTLDHAKQLRSHQTDAEIRLWYHLRAKRFMDKKFKRQKPIGPYIVDFICLELGLVVEVDGGQHVAQADYDKRRTQFLERRGLRVLRFWNNQVLQETDAVLEALRSEVLALSPAPSPASGRGEKNSASGKAVLLQPDSEPPPAKAPLPQADGESSPAKAPLPQVDGESSPAKAPLPLAGEGLGRGRNNK